MTNNFIKKYGKVVGYFLFVVLFLIPNFSFASSQCFKDGYTVLTINGVLTNESGAKQNSYFLSQKLGDNYNNQPLKVDFLLNPSHMGGVLDFTDALTQGFFNVKSDYDLTEILKDASNKISTEKVLLVGHSQGNFYANNFYTKVADIEGGIPKDSIRVYAIGTPANNVAGNFTLSKKDYITSDTDKAIATVAGAIFSMLPPNTHIELHSGDDYLGHDFANIYLKYKADEIISNIEVSLDKLTTNNIQNENAPCINPPTITLGHKIQGVILAVLDHPVDSTKKVGTEIKDNVVYLATGIYNTSLALGNGVLGGVSATASAISSFTQSIFNNSNNLAVNNSSNVINFDNQITNTTEEKDSAPETVQENPKTDTQQKEALLPSLSGSLNKTTEITPTQTLITASLPGTFVLRSGGGSASLSSPLLDEGGDGLSAQAGGGNSESTEENFEGDESNSADNLDNGATKPLICVAPKILNATEDACVDPIPFCIAPQTLVNNVCVDPLPPPAAEEPAKETPPLKTTTIDQDITLASGEYNYDNLIITNNAILTLNGDPTSSESFKGVKINAVNLTIDSGSSISADEKGYDANIGPGVSREDFVGASYGGFGQRGELVSNTYGSAIKPTDLGSGGAWLYRGGGAMQIVVSNTFTNNGIVSADGGGASSGGSIYITAKNITGSGIIHASGGPLYASGYFKSPGGGGRVALYYETLSFTGKAEAPGGCGSYDGWSKSCAKDGTVGFFDTIKNDLYVNNSWQFLQNDMPFSFNNIYISNGANVTSENDVQIKANNIFLDKNSSFTLANNQTLNIPIITIGGNSTLTLSGSEIFNTNTLSLIGNSIITVIPEKILSLTIPNLNIETGSTISADAKGYSSNIGPGAPSNLEGFAGASYGGIGDRNTTGLVYGSATESIDFGSGGNAPHTAGGGAIRLVVTNILTNNGVVSAGGNVSSSGGSIYVTAKSILGNGTFSANGGGLYVGGYFAGAGGGGRTALYYETFSFTGKAEALGGCGSYDGWSKVCAGDGTVGLFDTVNNNLAVNTSWRFQKNDSPFNFNHITLINGSQIAIDDGAEITTNDILLDGASTLTLSGGEIINTNSFLVTGNSTITVVPEKTLYLKIPNIIINSGSRIIADDKGSIIEGLGRRGGGSIHLAVDGNLENNGIISANGNKEHTIGGSVYVEVNKLSGGGLFQANGGGTSWPNPVAGAGGNIKIHYLESFFSGTTEASAGLYCFYGCAPGAADGTVEMVNKSI